MQTFKLWQNAWKDGYEKPLEISLPDSWQVAYQEMKGDSLPKLTREEMLEKIRQPIGMPPIREMAESGREAVILFDDLSRGTQVQEIAELVLAELEAGGIGKGHIRFICALGTHGAHTREDFVRKLGIDIVEQYPVFNHNPFYNCVEIGRDRDGQPVEINREFMECDVRIGIGSVSPHPLNGYGGGGKILFPGIASIVTTTANHGRREYNRVGNRGPSGLRLDIESMTKMAGRFFKIDAVINSHLDTVDLYAGDPIKEYYAAADASAVVNAVSRVEKRDVVIANANAKYNESTVAAYIAGMELRPGGDVVMINHCPCGHVVHYTVGAFGTNQGGPLWVPYAERIRESYSRVIYYTPFIDRMTPYMFNEPGKVVFAKTWEQVLELLSCHGEDTTAAVISDATLCYFPE